jgi:hypothetical protein
MLRHTREGKCEQCRAVVLYYIRESEILRALEFRRLKVQQDRAFSISALGSWPIAH